jgi:hypothetical protein
VGRPVEERSRELALSILDDARILAVMQRLAISQRVMSAGAEALIVARDALARARALQDAIPQTEKPEAPRAASPTQQTH